MKIIFMGTPDFSVKTLEALIESKHEIVLVVTQPDKPKGRSKALQPSPVKISALKHSIPVFQPKRIREQVAVDELKRYQADVMVVVAFGQILPKVVLEMTPYGCINVHASLLPAYRGAAPIQWPIINGDAKTGITIIKMDEGVDTGDMILKEEIPIDSEETGASLHDELATIGAKLCVRALLQIEDGTANYQAQGKATTPYAKMLTKEMGKVDWAKSAVEIERLVRGLNSWPGVYTILDGKELKIWKSQVVEVTKETAQIGAIAYIDKDSIIIQTGMGQLKLLEIQLPGKKRMTVDAFLRGHKLDVGVILG